MKKNKMNYESIIRKINYWKNYDGTGDEYRKNNDLDCVLTGGNLFADTIVSLWLPLRYTLNYFECQKWTEWKEYEAKVLRAKRMGLKDCNEFLEDLIANIEIYLPDHAISRKLSELFVIGQSKSNVMLLPYRKWNTMRGSKPYWDYMPHFLFDLLNTEDIECLRAIRTWIEKENLEIFFENAILDINHIKDLAGTGNVCSHLPRDISVQILIKNYTDVLRERERLLENDYEKCKVSNEYASWLDAARRVLNPSNKIPRNIYEGTETTWKKEEEERKIAEQRKTLVRLTEDDLDWKDLYLNNQKSKDAWLEGTYLLLFRKNEDGSISGSKWTIEFQREEYKPCCHTANAPIDAFNLYYKSYENMAGMLQYKEPNENGDSCYEYSTLQDGVNSYGKFIHSFKTIEAAKQGALYRNECIGWGNYYKDNLIRINWSNVDIANVEKDYLKKEIHKKKLQLLFAEKYTDIYTALAEHDSPGNAIHDISSKLHITREDVIKTLEFMPTMFCKNKLEEARRMVEKVEGKL